MPITKIERDWDLVGELVIKKFESKVGLKFPKDYFDFLVTQNGGRLRPQHYFTIQRRGKPVQEAIKAFYGLGSTSSSYDSFDNFKTFHIQERRMPEYLLPIGSDGSNQICIFLGKERFGEILFWEMEGEVEFDHDTNQWIEDPLSNCITIAKSFDEFVKDLTIDFVD